MKIINYIITQNSQILNAASFFIVVHHSWTCSKDKRQVLILYEYAITNTVSIPKQPSCEKKWPQNVRV